MSPGSAKLSVADPSIATPAPPDCEELIVAGAPSAPGAIVMEFCVAELPTVIEPNVGAGCAHAHPATTTHPNRKTAALNLCTAHLRCSTAARHPRHPATSAAGWN